MVTLSNTNRILQFLHYFNREKIPTDSKLFHLTLSVYRHYLIKLKPIIYYEVQNKLMTLSTSIKSDARPCEPFRTNIRSCKTIQLLHRNLNSEKTAMNKTVVTHKKWH